MTFEYIYGKQADQFSFIHVPKILIKEKRFENMSLEAKFLYGLIIEKMNRYDKNKWVDKDGCVFVIYSFDEISEDMNCSLRCARCCLDELQSADLLDIKKRTDIDSLAIYPKKIHYVRNI